MGVWLRRGFWSVVLGFVTAWAVAWGIIVSLWAGWYEPQMEWRGAGIGVVDPWVVEKGGNRWPGYETEDWHGERFNRENSFNARMRGKADRIRELGGAAYAEEQRRLWEASFPELDEMMGGQLTTIDERSRELAAGIVLPPEQRIDDEVGVFPPPELRARVAATDADWFYVYAERTGWPSLMLLSHHGMDVTHPDSGSTTVEWSEGVIEIDALKRSPYPGMKAITLTLPYLPVWPAVIGNTAFFSAGWFGLFSTLAGCRTLRRRAAGRCPRCNYDLQRVVGAKCPECGRASRGRRGG